MNKLLLVTCLSFFSLNVSATPEEDKTFESIYTVCNRLPIGVNKVVENFKDELKGSKLKPFSQIKIENLGPFSSPVEKLFEEVVDRRLIVFYDSFVRNSELLATAKDDQLSEVSATFTRMIVKDCRMTLSDTLIPGYEKLN